MFSYQEFKKLYHLPFLSVIKRSPSLDGFGMPNSLSPGQSFLDITKKWNCSLRSIITQIDLNEYKSELGKFVASMELSSL